MALEAAGPDDAGRAGIALAKKLTFGVDVDIPKVKILTPLPVGGRPEQGQRKKRVYYG